MKTDAEVRVRFDPNTNRTYVSFLNGADTNKIKSAYVRIWGKGDRLYFLPATPENGSKINADKHAFSVSKYNAALEKFRGEYTTLLHDPVNGYFYVDCKLKDYHDKKLPVATPQEPHLESNEVIEVVPMVKKEKPKSAPVENIRDYKSDLTDLIFKYLRDGELEKAQCAVEIGDDLGIFKTR